MYYEDWHAEYDRNITEWEPEKGDRIKIKDLTTEHLCNIMNWMHHPDRYSAYALGGTDFIDFMDGECKYRRLIAFANNEPYITQDETGKYIIVNK